MDMKQSKLIENVVNVLLGSGMGSTELQTIVDLLDEADQNMIDILKEEISSIIIDIGLE